MFIRNIFSHNNTTNQKDWRLPMKKYLLGALACTAVIGTVAVMSADYGAKNRRKLLRCKGNMFRTMGTMLDTMMELKK